MLKLLKTRTLKRISVEGDLGIANDAPVNVGIGLHDSGAPERADAHLAQALGDDGCLSSTREERVVMSCLSGAMVASRSSLKKSTNRLRK